MDDDLTTDELLKAWDDAAPKVDDIVEMINPGHWSDGLLAVIKELRQWGVIANVLNAPNGSHMYYTVMKDGEIPIRLGWEQFVKVEVDGPL